jgi:hypothetical protein
MFAVVEQEQHVAIAQGPRQGRQRLVGVVVEQTNRAADGAQDKPRVGEWGQVDEANAVDKLGLQDGRGGEAETCFADATRAGQGDQTRAFLEHEPADFVDFARPSHQRPRWQGQAARSGLHDRGPHYA